VTDTNERREARKRLRPDDEEIARIEEAARFEEVYIQDAATLLANAPLDTPFVVDQVMPDEGIVFLAGRPGSMKSWLAYDAALAVARKRPWLSFDVPDKGKVLVLNFDNPSHELGRRFRRLGLKPDDPIYFHSPAAKLPPEGLPAMLQLPQAIEPIHMILSRIRPHLVIVDSYRQSHTGEEHSSQDMGRVMSCLRSMAGFGCCVLVLHHLRKQGQQQKEDDDEPLRGSTEIEASADVIMLAKDGIITLKKTRGWKPLILECDYLVKDDGESTLVQTRGELTALIAALQQGPLSRQDIQTQLGIGRDAAQRLIDRAKAAGVVQDKARTSAQDKRLIELKPTDEE
jgi:hypothetical protein